MLLISCISDLRSDITTHDILRPQQNGPYRLLSILNTTHHYENDFSFFRTMDQWIQKVSLVAVLFFFSVFYPGLVQL